MPSNKAARERQDTFLIAADAWRALACGDDAAMAEAPRNAIDARLDNEFAAERRQALSDIRLPKEDE